MEARPYVFVGCGFHAAPHLHRIIFSRDFFQVVILYHHLDFLMQYLLQKRLCTFMLRFFEQVFRQALFYNHAFVHKQDA